MKMDVSIENHGLAGQDLLVLIYCLLKQSLGLHTSQEVDSRAIYIERTRKATRRKI